MLLNQAKQLNEMRIPTLYLSYEDMHANLLPQLFRIQHFLGFEDDESIERAFCAYYRKKEDEKIKRVQKKDLSQDVLQGFNRETFQAKLNEVTQFLENTHAHFLRLDDFVISKDT